MDAALRARLGRHAEWNASGGSSGEQLVLVDGDLQGADLTNVDFSGADLPGTNFERALLTGADFHQCNLASCLFVDADLSKANLTKANLDYAVLAGARLDFARGSRASFVDADLSGASLRSADLRHADLSSANLTGADLTEANLEGARLPATAGGAHYARGTQLAKDLLEGMDAPEDPEREAQHAEHERRNAELLEVYYVRSGQQPPTARSTAEMEFAMALEPCPRCGSHEITKSTVRGGGTAWTLDAVCAPCGDKRSMTFAAKGDPPVTHSADELGSGPSLWIRKETFEKELARVLALVDKDPAALQRAVVTVNELIKLLRPSPELDKLLLQRAALHAKRS